VPLSETRSGDALLSATAWEGPAHLPPIRVRVRVRVRVLPRRRGFKRGVSGRRHSVARRPAQALRGGKSRPRVGPRWGSGWVGMGELGAQGQGAGGAAGVARFATAP